MEQKPKVSAVKRVRECFSNSPNPLTLLEIQTTTGLKATEVSMALCYLKNNNFVNREQIPNPAGKGLKLVWLYTYFPNKVEVVNAN